MELFTIDPTNNNRRGAIIEHYESFIWTDRYSSFGDFTVVAEPTPTMLARLVPGVLVGLDESNRVMMIKSALREEDADGKKVLTVKGISLEAKLMDRVAKKVLSAAVWRLTGTGGAMIATMVNDICVDGTGISASDVIPHLTVTDLSGGSSSRKRNVKPGTLYERVKEICDAYGLGFRITVIPNNPTLKFEIYIGTNRSGIGGVAFSEAYDNLSSSAYLLAEDGYKNVAYVVAQNGTRIVTATGSSGVTGLARNVLYVEANDIDTVAGADLQDELLERGLDALAEHKKMKLFDGTVNPEVTFRYNRDYFLGDKVSMRGDNGERQVMTVVEHIWAADSSGYKSYPTLSSTGAV